MKKEYDLKKLKVKRRGILPALQANKTTSNKIRITIALDKEVIDYFKAEAELPGTSPYQTQINKALKQLINQWHETNQTDIEEVKTQLLHDSKFIHQLAKELKQQH